MKNVGVLASGRGSNLRALLDAQAAGTLGPARIVLVISDREDALALECARRAGVPAEFCNPGGLDRESYEEAVLERLATYQVDLLCLAGYMRRLTPRFIAAFKGPILNIHPSLLPAFRGLHAQRQAWEYGVKVSGATVHLVDAELDNGPIVLQESVPVLRCDSPETLSARILDVEHRLFSRAVALVAMGQVRIEGRRVRLEV